MTLEKFLYESLFPAFFFLAGSFFAAERWGWMAFTVFWGLLTREAMKAHNRKEIIRELRKEIYHD